MGLREGAFFLGEGGGRAGEFWCFFQKKVLALPHVLINKLLTPPLLGDSDRVEGIVGSSSNSSKLNDSGDQAADRQQLEQETIPE